METAMKLNDTKTQVISEAVKTETPVIIMQLCGARDNPKIEGMRTYDFETINTNIKDFEGIEFGSSYIKSPSITDNSINVNGAVKIPDPVNPNAVKVEDINIYLNVNSIETNPLNGLKNLTGNAGFISNSIGDIEFKEENSSNKVNQLHN